MQVGQVFICSLGRDDHALSDTSHTKKGNRQDLGCDSKDTAITVEAKYETSPLFLFGTLMRLMETVL